MSRLSDTLRTVLAAAEAEADFRAVEQALARRRLRFTLKAAATQAMPALPAAPWFDQARQLSVQASADAGRLQLRFQAQGYAAMRRWARLSARLLASRDGELLVDQRFRFSPSGEGVVILSDTPEVRRALGGFEVLAEREP